MKKFFLLLSAMLLPVAFAAAQALMPAQNKKGKWGYLNEDGTTALDYKYDEAYAFADGRAKVKKGTKWGYIDPSGNEVIKIQYSEMGTWDNGRCKVAIGGSEKNGSLTGAKYGFIDALGNVLLKPEYDKIGPFEDGLAHIQKGGKYGYIDTNFQFVVPCAYSFIGKFNPQGYCWVANGGKLVKNEISFAKYGIVDRKGNVVIKPEYYHIGTFTDMCVDNNPVLCQTLYSAEGRQLAQKMAKEAQKGMGAKSFGASFTGAHDEVIEEAAERARKAAEKYKLQARENMTDEMARLMAESPVWNLQSYQFIEEKPFSELNMDNSDYFVVSKNTLYKSTDVHTLQAKAVDGIGIIDKSGNVLLKPGLYNLAFLPSEGLLPVLKSDKKGFTVNYVKEDGKLLLPKWAPAVCISPFVNGVAVISGDGSQYLIDKTGKTISSNYQIILPQSNGNHLVKGANGYGIISCTGAEVVSPAWNLILPEKCGLYCAQKNKGEVFGYLGLNGEYALQPIYAVARSFDHNTASVKTEAGWGVIDTNGNYVVDCKWEDTMTVSPHYNTACWVKHEDLWSLVNTATQKPVFDNKYYGVDNFDESGRAVIHTVDNLYGCIDTKGNIILPMRLSSPKMVKECLDDMKQNDKTSLTEVEAHRYNIKNNPARNGFRLSHTIDNSMWDY